MGTIRWLVMSRDVSQTIRVTGEPVIVAAMILDVDTGLVRGLAAGADSESALASAVAMALARPAGTLEPGPPDEVAVEVGIGEAVAAELGRQLGPRSAPRVHEVVPGDEAEDIFDSFLGHVAGREQVPGDPPTPAEWRLLYDQVAGFTKAAPWQRYETDVDFELDLTFGGRSLKLRGVIMGAADIQHGLALYPEEDGHSGPGVPPPSSIPLICTLDRPFELPPDLRQRAYRYGWAKKATRLPAFFGIAQDHAREFSAEEVRLFALATAAIVAHDRAGAEIGTETSGRLGLPDGDAGSFSVRTRQRLDDQP